MTFKELLDSVNFDNVAPHIVRMYPDMEGCLGWFNLHFDILRQMKPERRINANSDVCHITMEDWEDGTGLHLNAFPMEGDLWEHSLTKELIIAPDVKASNEELAACCLWHTSFYGFTYDMVDDRLHIGEECNQPISTPDKCNERMEHISRFILKVAPHLSHINNYIKIDQLRRLYSSDLFGITTIKSVADSNTDSATYLNGLIAKYDMLPETKHYIIYIARGYDYDLELDDGITHEALRPAEYELMNTIYEKIDGKVTGGTVDLIIGIEPELGHQTLLTIVGYNSEQPITYDIIDD